MRRMLVFGLALLSLPSAMGQDAELKRFERNQQALQKLFPTLDGTSEKTVHERVTQAANRHNLRVTIKQFQQVAVGDGFRKLKLTVTGTEEFGPTLGFLNTLETGPGFLRIEALDLKYARTIVDAEDRERHLLEVSLDLAALGYDWKSGGKDLAAHRNRLARMLRFHEATHTSRLLEYLTHTFREFPNVWLTRLHLDDQAVKLEGSARGGDPEPIAKLHLALRGDPRIVARFERFQLGPIRVERLPAGFNAMNVTRFTSSLPIGAPRIVNLETILPVAVSGRGDDSGISLHKIVEGFAAKRWKQVTQAFNAMRSRHDFNLMKEKHPAAVARLEILVAYAYLKMRRLREAASRIEASLTMRVDDPAALLLMSRASLPHKAKDADRAKAKEFLIQMAREGGLPLVRALDPKHDKALLELLQDPDLAVRLMKARNDHYLNRELRNLFRSALRRVG